MFVQFDVHAMDAHTIAIGLMVMHLLTRAYEKGLPGLPGKALASDTKLCWTQNGEKKEEKEGKRRKKKNANKKKKEKREKEKER